MCPRAGLRLHAFIDIHRFTDRTTSADLSSFPWMPRVAPVVVLNTDDPCQGPPPELSCRGSSRLPRRWWPASFFCFFFGSSGSRDAHPQRSPTILPTGSSSAQSLERNRAAHLGGSSRPEPASPRVVISATGVRRRNHARLNARPRRSESSYVEVCRGDRR